MTQQQAVDELQVVQHQFAAQKAEMKKLSEQIAAETEKTSAIGCRYSAPSVATPVPLQKAEPSKR